MSQEARHQQVSFLLQAGHNSRETSVIRHHALVNDAALQQVSLECLGKHVQPLREGHMMPVGCVAFVEAAMRLAGANVPENISYPQALMPWLKRSLLQREAGQVQGRWFIKPLTTKTFTGFVVDIADRELLDEHDCAQRDVFEALPSNQLVWVSEPVTWLSEVRYYVIDGKIVGAGRYDDGPDEAPCPAQAEVSAMVKDYVSTGEAPRGFGLDAGVLASGETALVEVNDGWALGYYSGSLTRANYAELLRSRWTQLLATRR